MTRMLPIPGTWSWHGDEKDARDHWWHPSSPWCAFMADRGLVHLCPEEPYVWTTSLNGAAFWRSSHIDWQAAGASLVFYLANPNTIGPNEVPVEQRNLIAHSHGLQVVLYACAYRGLQINRLISIASPVRKDMAALARAARPHIRKWAHVYTDWSDKVQWWGEFFDGSFGVARSHPMADWNYNIPKLGHSGAFKPENFERVWVEMGLAEWLKVA